MSKKSDAPKGCKNGKSYSSGHREKKKVARYEDTIDHLLAPPEILIPGTQEVVPAFKGVFPISRYANTSLLCRRLNILHNKK